jgi:hypothetical protein
VYRMVKFVVILGFGWMIVNSLPDLARYLKMRSL